MVRVRLLAVEPLSGVLPKNHWYTTGVVPTESDVNVTVVPAKLVMDCGWISNAGNWAKVPVSETLATRVRARGSVVPVAALDQPVNTQPVAGVAVAVTVVLLA